MALNNSISKQQFAFSKSSRFPSLKQSSANVELSFEHEGGNLELVSTVRGADAWVKRFEGDAIIELGFDIEWRASLQRGGSPGKAATLQLVSLRCGGKDEVSASMYMSACT